MPTVEMRRMTNQRRRRILILVRMKTMRKMEGGRMKCWRKLHGLRWSRLLTLKQKV